MKASGTRRTLIIGATSAIAQETARRMARGGDEFFLVARDPNRLGAVQDDLVLRHGVRAHGAVLDVVEFEKHEQVLSEATRTLGTVDVVLIAHGDLPDQKACESAAELAVRSFSVNALSVLSLLTRMATYLEQQGHGTLVVISSVAGDRGRRSNYVYGSAKGAVSLFFRACGAAYTLRVSGSSPSSPVLWIHP
jgi:decaprenylphospho-beta-D-erythro-pentofuranosid-2-ulose 2-reductase